MNIFSKTNLVIYAMVLAFVFLGLTSRCPAREKSIQKNNPGAAASKMDSLLRELHKKKQFNGTILVAKGDKNFYKKAFGYENIETKTPLTTASSFNLASVSKQFTAMAIMMLAEQKKLHYDDPITRHIPGLSCEDVTIRHLLHHTSGLPDIYRLLRQDWDKSKIAGNDDLIALFKERKIKPAFKPGSRFKYSNTGYILLASIVGKVSGKPFDVFMKERIFQPLGMRNSFVYHLKMKAPPAKWAFGFYWQEGQAYPNEQIYCDGMVGDGNIFSSVEDLFIWDQALFTEKLVKKSTLDQAFTPGKLTNGDSTGYGFGWYILNGGLQVAHGGGWVGFRTHIGRDLKNRETLILLDNSTNNNLRRIVRALSNIMHGKPYSLPGM